MGACDGIAGQYGPGRTIDTNQPILVSHAQVRGGDGLMTASNTWLNSNGKTADWNACGDSNYVKNMGYSLEGIVAAFSLWGGPDIDMGWRSPLKVGRVHWMRWHLQPGGQLCDVDQ